MPRIVSATVIALTLLFVLPVAAAAEAFPRPAGLEPSVRFWTRVYAEIDLSGGVIHDTEHMDIVYEVLRFPPDLSRRERDRKVAKAKRDKVMALKRLGRGKRDNLSAEEKRILAAWPTGVSNQTLRHAASTVRFQLGQADRFKAGLARAGAWRDHIEQVMDQAGLPTELVALPHVESSYRPTAYSSIGAAGMWQFTRGTGRLFMRVDDVVDERLDAHISTVAAASLLKRNYELLGTWPLAITAYNHGAGGMARAVREVGTTDIMRIIERYDGRSFGFASRNFYAEFLAALDVDRDAERFFGPIHQDHPRSFESVVLDAYYPSAALEKAFGIDRDTLRAYNPSLRPAVFSGNKYVPKGYKLSLPPQSVTLSRDETLASIPASDRKSAQHRDRYYKVRRGDSLSKIAQRYRIRERELVAANNLRSRHKIRVGQVLVLPDHARRSQSTLARSGPTKNGVYRVRRGDNLSSIAARFNVSANELAAMNKLRNRNRVYIGQKLAVPDHGLPSVATSARPADGIYTVKSGDNLSLIAQRFGTSSRDLAAANALRNRHRVYVGQQLRIPGSGPSEIARNVSYRVKRGDNLSTIAERAGVSESEIMTANSLRNRNRLYVGQELLIPGGDRITTASAPPPDGIYRVRRGDNLSKIAARFGVNEKALIAENQLPNRDRVFVGQKLRIPGAVDVAKATPAPSPAPEPERAEPPESVADESSGGPARIAAEADAPDVETQERGPASAGAQALAASRPTAAASDATEIAAAEAGALLTPPPDPSDYEVATDDRVTVQAAETLGHYAEWLEIKTSRLRRINGLKFGAPVAIGRKTKLDFSRVTPEIFVQRRLAYHHSLQAEYFNVFEVVGTKTHLLRNGESLWYLAERKYEVPIWLIRQYNPDLDFGSLRAGTRMVIPQVGPRGA